MKLDSIKVTMEEKDDAISIKVSKLNVGISVYDNGSVMVCNAEEERIYHLHKTRHGGFKLKEGTLL